LKEQLQGLERREERLIAEREKLMNVVYFGAGEAPYLPDLKIGVFSSFAFSTHTTNSKAPILIEWSFPIKVSMMELNLTSVSSIHISVKHKASSCEAAIQSFVGDVLNNVIEAMGAEVTLGAEMGLWAGERWDFAVIYKDWVPIGVVEVKKPGKIKYKTAMENSSVLRQVYDYLWSLHSFFGIKNPIAILTNYYEWRICSIDTEKEADTEENPEILVGDVFGHRHKDVICVLASAIRAMVDGAGNIDTNIPVSLIAKKRYIKITKETWFWEPLTPKAVNTYNNQALSISQLQIPSSLVQNFHLLYPLGSGLSGKSYLACDLNGSVCCLKLFDKIYDNGKVDTEAVTWKNVWSTWHESCSKVRSLILRNRSALLMPFFQDVVAEDPDLECKVRAAATHMAESGFEHTDLQGRRHVKILPFIEEEDRVIFIDLGRVNSINQDDEDAVLEAVDRMVLSVMNPEVSMEL
jgi:hypothetical protein